MIICHLPVTFAMVIATATTMLYLNIPMMTMVQQMAKSVNSFSLLAIPFFILMGEIMGAGGISDRLLKFANVLVGRFRGGLAFVNVLASMFFGGISGSAVADVSSLGKIEIPMMEDAGYNKDFSICVTVSSACQGLLIPPSHNMVLYAMTAGGVSVGKLFLAGYAPGILLGVALMALCYIFAIKRNYPKGDPVSFKEALVITKDAVFAIGAMFIIVGGVVAGLFTATEAAAIGCIYCLLVATLVYRQLSLKDMGRILYNTVKTLAMIYSLIAAAGAFAWMMAYLRIPAKFTGILMDVSDNKIVVLLLINVLLLLLGCIMDMAPLILIMTRCAEVWHGSRSVRHHAHCKPGHRPADTSRWLLPVCRLCCGRCQDRKGHQVHAALLPDNGRRFADDHLYPGAEHDAAQPDDVRCG